VPVQSKDLETVSTVCVELSVPLQAKTVKTVHKFVRALNTGLKPGENEMRDFEENPLVNDEYDYLMR